MSLLEPDGVNLNNRATGIPYASSPLQPAGLSNGRRYYQKVGIFWDYESYLEKSGIGSSEEALKIQSELNLSGVSLTLCPPRGRKETADPMIVADMMAFAIDNPAPAVIVLISGDGDFSYALSLLNGRHYTICVVVNHAQAPAVLRTAATHVLNWRLDVLKMAVKETPAPTQRAVKMHKTPVVSTNTTVTTPATAKPSPATPRTPLHSIPSLRTPTSRTAAAAPITKPSATPSTPSVRPSNPSTSSVVSHTAKPPVTPIRVAASSALVANAATPTAKAIAPKASSSSVQPEVAKVVAPTRAPSAAVQKEEDNSDAEGVDSDSEDESDETGDSDEEDDEETDDDYDTASSDADDASESEAQHGEDATVEDGRLGAEGAMVGEGAEGFNDSKSARVSAAEDEPEAESEDDVVSLTASLKSTSISKPSPLKEVFRFGSTNSSPKFTAQPPQPPNAPSQSVKISRKERQYFGDLLEVLRLLHTEGDRKPLRSKVGLRLLSNNPFLYQREGGPVDFKQYAAAAAEKGIVKLGGESGLAWISLRVRVESI
ncbi:hypothetical protein HK097_008566 [Rhizophlyctis rosea]|uniref:NYN domain-containing protein n=1 Tax=Rhizophlyctis rosea TaxID=64517 RepID=A0AAD5X4H0_9FUNG|nr:hypothetical protein HK097_008566 [Rhizophlyctis rosea]